MKQIEWRINLIEEIAYRRCVLFLGAGISATAKNANSQSPVTWEEFLKGAISLINHAPEETRVYVNELISHGNYLMALQVIYNNSDPGHYASYLRQTFNTPNFKASKTHELIKAIDSKIVVTTNFDKIYENLCNEHGYTTATYRETEKILTNLKSTENLIIKAHGTIDNVNQIIFTQKQYNEARKQIPDFYEVLKALFLTQTVLFLGYSLNDPDINLLMETVGNISPSSNPHYIVVKEGINDELKRYWQECYNVFPLEYGPEYENLGENIQNLHDAVIAYRAAKRIP